MGLAETLSGEPVPCASAAYCLNCPPLGMPVALGACGRCRYAAQFGGLSNLWKPFKPGQKHPQEVRRQKAAKQEQIEQKRQAKASRDRSKIRIQAQARRAERRTERSIIQATVNSGRSRQDGDHTLQGWITLDTKLQTGRSNPIVYAAEVAKVRADARRAGTSYGALVIRSKAGQGFVVMDEKDFACLAAALNERKSSE